ncbi:MAG: GFA family protein [Gammaproteobacteria bacterium]|nr:GFA family protein [Gammaproteobacteria bacterium]
MTTENSFPQSGHCTCGEIHFTLKTPPLFVHCCHCSWCQRESGSAFALNALIEADRLEVTQGTPEMIELPSNSGKGQQVFRCPGCHTALWSQYGAAGEAISFVKVGVLENPDSCPPDIHIFTSTKLSWVQLPPETPASETYYRRSEQWSAASIARYNTALGRT